MSNPSVPIIDDVVALWGAIVVPFFTSFRGAGPVADGFGSGFIVRAYGKRWLVTALHVVQEAVRHGPCVINVGGAGVLLERVPFVADGPGDLAFTPIDAILRTSQLPRVHAIDLDQPDGPFVSLGHHLLMGYPASRNKLDPRWGKVHRRLLSITATPAPKEAAVETEIRDPLLFSYEPTAQVDTFFKQKAPPALHGMSGGPAVELLVTRSLLGETSISVRLSGVLVEWKKRQKIVVATPADRLKRVLREIQP